MNRARTGWALLGTLLLPAAALSAVGTVTALEGQANKRGAKGEAAVLKEGSPVELGDLLRVTKGALKITLNDQSVLMLAQGADLEITEADFSEQERRSFSAKLGLGALWAHVAKLAAGSTAKFEVVTERAVAGVRGTTFQVEVVSDGSGTETRIGVIEGSVSVDPRAQPAPVAMASRARAPPTGMSMAAGPVQAAAPPAPTSSPAAALAAGPPAPAPAPKGPEEVSAGNGLLVSVDGVTRGPLHPLPAAFQGFITERGAERAPAPEHREERREDKRDRPHGR